MVTPTMIVLIDSNKDIAQQCGRYLRQAVGWPSLPDVNESVQPKLYPLCSVISFVRLETS